jgi:hypothetical protein
VHSSVKTVPRKYKGGRVSLADTYDDYMVRAAVEAQASMPDPESVASVQPESTQFEFEELLPTLTEAEVFGEDFLEFKRYVDETSALLDAALKKEFGMTSDEIWKHLRNADAKRKRQKKEKVRTKVAPKDTR